MFYEKCTYFSKLIYDNKTTLFEHDEIYMHTQKIIRMYMTEIHLLNKDTTSTASCALPEESGCSHPKVPP